MGIAANTREDRADPGTTHAAARTRILSALESDDFREVLEFALDALLQRFDGPQRSMAILENERDNIPLPGGTQLLETLGRAVSALDEARDEGVMTAGTDRPSRVAHQPEAIVNLIAAMGHRDQLDEIVGPVVAGLRSILEADLCSVAVAEGGQLRSVAVDACDPDVGQSARASLPDHVASIDFSGGHGYHLWSGLADLATSESGRMLARAGIRSAMRVSVGPAGAPLGVVTIGSLQPGKYNKADARLVSQVVQPLGVAIAYFRDRELAKQRATRLELVNTILAGLGEGGTTAELASRFLSGCRLLVKADHCGVMQFDREAGLAVRLAYESDVAGPEAGPATALISQLPPALEGNAATPEITDDYRAVESPAPYARMMMALGLYSRLQVPLVLRGGAEGAVAFWGLGTSRFTAEDAELVMSLAGPFTIALERAKALESLAESERRYRSLVAQADEMILLVDADTHRLLDANPFAARLLGYSEAELLTLRLQDLVVAGESHVPTHVVEGPAQPAEQLYRRKDGTAVDLEVVASPLAVGGRQATLVLGRDSSEGRTLQRQLVQSQKMESLGTMAGAVAHDFNNLLTTIMGFASLLKRSPALAGEDRENLSLIEDASRKAADLTGRLLSFARGGLVRFGPVDLLQVIDDAVRLTEPAMANTITVSVPIGPVVVEGDAGQIHQALLNIVLNARDAMPDGGTISIAVRTDGPDAIVEIADTGPGMSEETRLRIFEPFYTTKPLGSGTGLGMAITYGIVQGHHGEITVESTPGAGTTFTIRLPRLEGQSTVPTVNDPGEGNLVLVVDDDEMVRRATTATLWHLGYSVASSAGGAVAVELVRARPERFSAVLLDLVMPGMTGSETFHALAALRPDLPVIVVTGFAADRHIDADMKRRIAGLVRKPFTGGHLAAALLAAGVAPVRATT